MRRLAALLGLLTTLGAAWLLLADGRDRGSDDGPAASSAPAPRAEVVDEPRPAPAVLRGDPRPAEPPRPDEALAPDARGGEVAPPEAEALVSRREAPVAPGAVVDLVRPTAPGTLRVRRDDLLGRVLPYGERATWEARDPQWTGVARIDVSDGATAHDGPTTAVRGTVVTEDGAGLSGAEVILYSSFYLRRSRYDHRVVEIGRTHTDADGVFDLRAIALDTIHFGADGELLVTIRHPYVADLVAQRLPRIQPGRESDVGPLVLPDTSAVIRGVIRDFSGAPVVGAVVRVSGAMNPVIYDKTDRMVVLQDCPSAVTDAEGRYVLEDFAAGVHDVSVHVNIDCVLHQSRRWEGEATWSPTVRAGNEIRGRVEDPDGNPVKAAVVSGGGNWTPSNADGTFWLDNVDPGPLTLEVSHHAWRRVYVLDVPTNAEEVRIRLKERLARVELDLSDAVGAPVAVVTLAWQWAEGAGPTMFTPQSPYWGAEDGHYVLTVPEGAVGARLADLQGHVLDLDAEALRDGTRSAMAFAEAE